MRRTGFAFALPILLPLLGGAFARADDAPTPVAPPAPPAVPVGPDAPTKPGPEAPKPEAPKKDEPKADAAGIVWLHDYEEGKTKAAEQKKGLFVYLTPAWFT